MIEKINNMLKEIGSEFRTEDGLTLARYIDHLTFLKKSFTSTEEMYQYVLDIYEKNTLTKSSKIRKFNVYYKDSVFAQSITFVDKTSEFITEILENIVKDFSKNVNCLYHIDMSCIKEESNILHQ